jgi:mono/diheme cytochrome c family protein
MGVGFIKTSTGGELVTLSCAACHSSQLFGRPVMGLTQRFPRANEFFSLGQTAVKNVSPAVFQAMTLSTAAEKAMYATTRDHMRAVGLRDPQTLGLDTSLAQVALSLSKRNADGQATRSKIFEKHPRPNFLDHHVADSKPAVWWNVKYKTRWLSDGSVLSGNPIFTNFIWNEIGRGADLPALTDWMEKNQTVVEDLTAAIFASQPPKWNEYLGQVAPIRVERAKRGETIYQAACQKCHGSYTKDWSQGHATVQVEYHPQTFIKDVGTDPGRRQGMRALAEALNPLEVSRKNQIVIQEQTGYVPPPLEGIWARYPYFHNNSIPSLCALMTPPELRPMTYVAGEPLVPGRDYDLDCVGYPSESAAPKDWLRDPAYRFDTRKVGLSNIGHYDRIFRVDGAERFTPDQKRDLIEYLKTL